MFKALKAHVIIMLYFIVSSCPGGQISTTLANGNVVLVNGLGTDIGTIYMYTCDAGYEMVGSPTVYCQSNATWYPASAPSCTRK